MDEKERQEFSLDDIIKEFAGEEPEKAPEPVAEEPVAEEPAAQLPAEEPESAETRKTMKLKTLRMKPLKETEETVRVEALAGATVRVAEIPEEVPAEKPKKQWKWKRKKEVPEELPEEEPPIEEYIPEEPEPEKVYIPPRYIAYKPQFRAQQIKHKLVEGPEKRYFQLLEMGTGKLQVGIFLSFLVVLVSAASTAMYAMGMVQENRFRLMVFGQLLSLLLSALLGSNQLIEGLTDLGKKRISLNTFLAVTFLVCLTDGIMCLKQVRVPCCAAFSLEVTMALWSAYQRRYTEMGQTDTMRKAQNLDGIAACPGYMDGQKGLLRKQGEVEDFVDRYTETGKSERLLQNFGVLCMCASFAIGAWAGFNQVKLAGMNAGISVFLQVTAVCLLTAMPATAFICHSRPEAILERRLHKLGTVICGWQGVTGLSGKAVFPVTYKDLFPGDTVRLNGMKFFGSRDPDEVLGYATAVIAADGCGLTELFTQVLDSHNGRHYDAGNLHHYENGGVGAHVEGEVVLVGSASFLRDAGVEIPQENKLSYAVYVAIGGELCGLFAVSYDKTRAVTAGISALTAYRQLQCVLVSDDFMLTRGFLINKLGIKSKRFVILPHERRQQLQQTEPEKDNPSLLMTTQPGIAPLAYGVVGARALRTAGRLGAGLHVMGGLVGLGIMAVLVLLGSLDLITPVNVFLYQLVWLIPALLITEWTRTV